MRKTSVITLAALAVLLCAAQPAVAQKDTLKVSTLFTSHIIFSSDVTYADRSNSESIRSKIVEQNRNMIAVRAARPFTEPCSVSALESNGRMWTFIVTYEENPDNLIVDTRLPGFGRKDAGVTAAAPREEQAERRAGKRRSLREEESASTWKPGSAPLLSEVHQMKRSLYHIETREYGVSVSCDNLFAYSDITYLTLSVRNDSGISYSVSNATFVIEARRKGRREVSGDETIIPTSRHGALAAGPGAASTIVYSFEKLTLSKNQVLKVYLYEDTGQRNLVLSIAPNDINRARTLSGRY